MTLELTTDIVASLESLAAYKGLSIEDYLKQLLDRERHEQQRRQYVRLPPDVWIREVREWSQSHASDGLPRLSDEDISRESIYAERGF